MNPSPFPELILFCTDTSGVHANFVCLLGSAQNHLGLSPAALELEVFDHRSTHGNVRDLRRMELAVCPRSAPRGDHLSDRP